MDGAGMLGGSPEFVGVDASDALAVDGGFVGGESKSGLVDSDGMSNASPAESTSAFGNSEGGLLSSTKSPSSAAFDGLGGVSSDSKFGFAADVSAGDPISKSVEVVGGDGGRKLINDVVGSQNYQLGGGMDLSSLSDSLMSGLSGINAKSDDNSSKLLKELVGGVKAMSSSINSLKPEPSNTTIIPNKMAADLNQMIGLYST
jgi:hypothetical protein